MDVYLTNPFLVEENRRTPAPLHPSIDARVPCLGMDAEVWSRGDISLAATPIFSCDLLIGWHEVCFDTLKRTRVAEVEKEAWLNRCG